MTPTDIFTPASTPARWVFDLSMMVYAVCAAVFVVVFSLLVYSLVKFRKRKGDDGREPPQVYGSKQIELAWTIIPILIVLVLFLASARVIAFTQKGAPPGGLEVDVVAHQYWWEYRYPGLGVVTANGGFDRAPIWLAKGESGRAHFRSARGGQRPGGHDDGTGGKSREQGGTHHERADRRADEHPEHGRRARPPARVLAAGERRIGGNAGQCQRENCRRRIWNRQLANGGVPDPHRRAGEDDDEIAEERIFRLGNADGCEGGREEQRGFHGKRRGRPAGPGPGGGRDGEPTAHDCTDEERDHCQGRPEERQPGRTGGGEGHEDDVAGHVCGEDVSQGEEADGIDDAGDDRQREQRIRQVLRPIGLRAHLAHNATIGSYALGIGR